VRRTEVTIEDDEDDGFTYEEVKAGEYGVEEGDAGEDEEELATARGEDLATTATRARKPPTEPKSPSAPSQASQPAAKVPEAKVERKRERVDDFVRNYLVLMGFARTMDAFQTEWYDRALARQFRDDEASAADAPEAYLENRELAKRVAVLEGEAEKLRAATRTAEEALARM
jgi:hypothetical protein